MAVGTSNSATRCAMTPAELFATRFDRHSLSHRLRFDSPSQRNPLSACARHALGLDRPICCKRQAPKWWRVSWSFAPHGTATYYCSRAAGVPVRMRSAPTISQNGSFDASARLYCAARTHGMRAAPEALWTRTVSDDSYLRLLPTARPAVGSNGRSEQSARSAHAAVCRRVKGHPLDSGLRKEEELGSGGWGRRVQGRGAPRGCLASSTRPKAAFGTSGLISACTHRRDRPMRRHGDAWRIREAQQPMGVGGCLTGKNGPPQG
jgi:hypothetical protein